MKVVRFPQDAAGGIWLRSQNRQRFLTKQFRAMPTIAGDGIGAALMVGDSGVFVETE